MITQNFDRVCPKCKSINVFARTRKKPKYKCKNCDCEFDDPHAKNETVKLKNDYSQYSYLDE